MVKIFDPDGKQKNWNRCLKYLASIINVSPEDLYNKITPFEFLCKAGKAWMWYRDDMTTESIRIKLMRGRSEGSKRLEKCRDIDLKHGKVWGESQYLMIFPIPSSKYD